jgi:type VI protein secretion system component Hcp
MVIRKAGVLIVVAAALMGSLSANANNKSKTANSSKTGMPEAAGSYNFRCSGPALDLSLVSFSLPISRPASSLTGSGASKAPTSSLTVEFAANKEYSTLYAEIIRGSHYSSCTLVETVAASGGANATVFTWTFNEVVPTNVTAIWRDASTAGSQGADLPLALVRVTLNFNEVKLENSAGSKTATDNWTQTTQ